MASRSRRRRRHADQVVRDRTDHARLDVAHQLRELRQVELPDGTEEEEASEESETKTEEAEKQLALSAVEKPKEEASPEKEPSEEETPTDSESPGESSEEK